VKPGGGPGADAQPAGAQSAGAQPAGAQPARPEPGGRPKFTSRAAVLAVVICAVALSLAYPVREYIAERRQIDQLQALNNQLDGQVGHLRSEQRDFASPTFIEQQARDQLHMCFPSQKCYIVIYPSRPHAKDAHAASGTPWYGVLWKSVREAGQSQRK
jgi:cell division protein FtsB